MHTLLLLAALMAQEARPSHPAIHCLESNVHCAAAPAATPVVYTREPRSRLAFWTGLGLVASGSTLAVLAATSLQTSDGLGLPCGTDPVVAQGHPIALCKTNPTVLTTGLALAGGGAVLMLYGGQTVEVVVAPSYASSSVAMRLRF